MDDSRYQQSSRCERMGYEDDLLKYLDTVISEADKRIVRGNQRLIMANSEHTIVRPIFVFVVFILVSYIE